MLEEILGFAAPLCAGQGPALVVDGTLGDGGHSLALLQRFPSARLLAVDQDAEMLQRAESRLMQSCPGRFEVIHANFRELAALLHDRQLRPDFLLLDLGVSMHHFRGSARGFSYLDEALDMRLDPGLGPSAAELLNRLPEKELQRIFREYGEERFAGRIARAVAGARPLHSARALAKIVQQSAPHKPGRSGIHPATRVFQALRIAVNQELQSLELALQSLPSRLAQGGRMAVLSFHSLEDRAVKHRFQSLGRQRRGEPPTGFVQLTRKPLVPAEAEVRANPASRSAKLRVLAQSSDDSSGASGALA
ncbi:MAG: 16S rRNA (cytosine(1402)-N(4))-methyltransferase RsmH [Leptospirales bacterium]|nr:16S rRNA (cytosine(1402)-N(4))-methyltransferase RsmH [Leptospirales bacterium]